MWQANYTTNYWFDSNCHQIRRRSCCLERRFHRTRDPADKLAWITQLRALHQLYRRKVAAYWENLVKRNEKNPKRIWTSISGLMGRSSRPPEDPSFAASDFLAMFTTKMENLCASTADSPPPFFASTDSIFDGFRPILETDLRRLLISCNLKSCELDPLPPFIVMVGRDGALLEAITLNRRVVGSTPALAVT